TPAPGRRYSARANSLSSRLADLALGCSTRPKSYRYVSLSGACGMSNELQQRLDVLMYRLRTAYDGIGHSSGRPYVYFVYPPEKERAMQRMVDEQLRSDTTLSFHHIDILPLTITSLAGQEERRQQLLNDPLKTSGVTEAIMRLWA